MNELTSHDRHAIAHLLKAAAIVHRSERDAVSASRLEGLATLIQRSKPETFAAAFAQLDANDRSWLQRYIPLVHVLMHRSPTSLTYAGG